MKRWYRSKTLWFNTCTTAPLLFDAIATNVGLIQPLLPDKWRALAVAVIGVGNIWLRVITTQALSVRKPDDPPKP